MNIRLAKSKHSWLSQLAFTLAEVLVSVAIVGILFLALYGGMSSGFAYTQSARENLRATQIMLEYMEGVRLFNWDQLTSSNWIPLIFTNYYYPLAAAGESKGIPYVGRVTITTNPTMSPASTYNANMCQFSIVVNWTNAGVPHQRSMTTYVARNGVQNYVFTSTNN